MQTSLPEVTVYGALRDVMHKNDVGGKITLNLLGPMEDLIGVGAVEGLNGEITIVDGKALISTYSDNMYSLDKSTNVDAALLVVSNVGDLKKHQIDSPIGSITELEDWLNKYVVNNGLGDESFAFRMEVTGKANWHVISPPDPGQDHNSAAKKFNYKGKFQAVGFFSRVHQGVFTHQGRFTHLHFIDEQTHFAGHLDEMVSEGTVTIYLPK